MRVRFTFKHMDTSKSLMEVADAKFANLMRRFKLSPQLVHVRLDMDGPFKKIHATVITNNGQDIEAVVRGDNPYSLLDQLIQKIDSQLRRVKERLKFHKVKDDARLRGDRFDETTASLPMVGGLWSQPSIDADDILKLSPSARGPIVQGRAS